MRLKLLYTLVLLFCMSAFASSNECSRVSREGHSRLGTANRMQDGRPLVSEQAQPQQDNREETPFQVIKFLYI